MKPALDELVFRAASAASADAQSFVFGLIAHWPEEWPFDALAVLAEHPELWRRASAVIELAAEEYRSLTLAGCQVDHREFAAKFAPLDDLVRDDLNALREIEEHPTALRELEGHYWPAPGEHAAGYELLEELGRGTFARVFLAEEPALGHRRVVVKFCMHGRREARTLGPLVHRHVVPVYSAQFDERLRLNVLCMPYLSRATLLDVIQRGFGCAGHSPARVPTIRDADASSVRVTRRPPARARTILDIVEAVNGDGTFPAEPRRSARWWSRRSFVDGAVELATQIAEALAFVHQAGVCHGDIKPSNVLVTHDGRALLLDFNLAISADLAAVRGGTLAYMAPEHLHALSREKSGRSSPDNLRSDVFSLGATLYHLVTGRFPFGVPSDDLDRDEAVLDMLDRQRAGLPPVESLNPAVDARLAGVIHRCLALDPRDRPPSASELAELLRAQFDVARRCRRWAAGHPAATLGSAAAVVALAVAVALGATGRTASRPEGNFGGPGEPLAAVVRRTDRDGLMSPAVRSRPAAVDLNIESVELEDGCRAVSEQRYEAAIGHLDRVLEMNPEHLDARFVRGQARLLLGEQYAREAEIARYRNEKERAAITGDRSSELILGARDDFDLIRASHDHPMVKACAAYCRALTGDPAERSTVIELFQAAISLGFPADVAWNNIGVVQFRSVDFAAARASLERALGFNRDMGAAHANLGSTHLRLALSLPASRDGRSPERLEHLKQAAGHIQQALALDPSAAEIWLDAAEIYARMCQEHIQADSLAAEISPLVRQAVEAMQNAVALGCRPGDLEKLIRLCDPLAAESEVRKLLKREPPSEPPPRAIRLISPLGGRMLPMRLSAADRAR